jgi:hypothetical protein
MLHSQIPYLGRVNFAAQLLCGNVCDGLVQAFMEKQRPDSVHELLHALGGQRVAPVYRVGVHCRGMIWTNERICECALLPQAIVAKPTLAVLYFDIMEANKKDLAPHLLDTKPTAQ